jgi:hypothetical protein
VGGFSWAFKSALSPYFVGLAGFSVGKFILPNFAHWWLHSTLSNNTSLQVHCAPSNRFIHPFHQQKGTKFVPGQVTEWLDCGNKNATVYTNQRVLEFEKGKEELKGNNIKNTNSIIIEPCYIGSNVEITNSIIGPHASIGANTKITNSIIQNSIVQKDAKLNNATIHNSMLGVGAEVTGKSMDLSISDYTQLFA